MPTALPAPGVPDDGIKQADCARPMATLVVNAYSAPHPAEDSPVVDESVPAHAQPGLFAPAGASAPCTTGLVILSQKRVDPEVVMPTSLQGEHDGCLARGCTLLAEQAATAVAPAGHEFPAVHGMLAMDVAPVGAVGHDAGHAPPGQ